jgi:hypothetical protein
MEKGVVMSCLIRRFAAVAALTGLLLAYPGGAAATIRGGCTGTGTATSGGVDVTTATEWHIRKDDVGGGSGEGPTAHAGSVAAFALGIPIASGTSVPGESSGVVSGVSASTFALLGARFVVSGTADNGCSGEIEIIIDDVNPLLTVLGGGGAALAVIGLLAVLVMLRGGKSFARRVLDALFGLFGGLGLALALEQFGVLDPTQMIGLFIVIGAAIVGLLSTGIVGGGDVPDPALAPTLT